MTMHYINLLFSYLLTHIFRRELIKQALF